MKHGLVTGGTGGIGRGVTEALLASGWSVVATGVSAAEIATCPSAENLSTAPLDVTDQKAVDALVADLGPLHGLVNCAGILMREQEYDLGVFQQVIDVNLVGTMRMCLACHPSLAASGGAIVNTASMYSIFGGPHAPAYTASKGGVSQLTKALAGRWASDGIRVNAVAPGWIETEMTDAVRANPKREGEILGRTPLGRWGQPRDVGELVVWLLSDKASYATGTVYPIDGGYASM